MTWLRVIGAVARRPDLWVTGLRQAGRMAPPGWWRHRPFLPVPRGDYLEFRVVTQYGDPRHRPEPHDVVAYLAWCRRWDRAVGGR